MKITADTEDIKQLIATFHSAPEVARSEIIPVVHRGANNIKRLAKEHLALHSRARYLKHYPKSLSYDFDDAADAVEAEIGPDAGRLQGGMGRGVEYGSVNTSPMPHMTPAFHDEEPRFLREVGAAVVRSLR